MRYLLLVLLLTLVLWPSGVLAEEEPGEQPAKPLTPEQAAGAVLTAVQAEGEAALKALAEKDDPDPWLVVELLFLQGHAAEARGFATAAGDDDLAAYARRRGPLPQSEMAREALVAAHEARRKRAVDTVPHAPEHLREGGGVAKAYAEVFEGRLLREQRKASESIAPFARAASMAEALGWSRGAYVARYLAGQGALETAQYVLALGHFEQARAAAKRLGNKNDELGAILAIANVYTSQRNMPELLVWGQRALALAQELDVKFDMAYAHTLVADALGAMGRLQEARDHMQRAIALAEELGDKSLMLTILSDLAHDEKRAGNFSAAIRLYEKAQALLEEVEHPNAEAVILFSMGDLYRLLRNPERALGYLRAARAMFLEMRDGHSLARASDLIGDLLSLIGEREEAVRLWTEAAQVFEAVGDTANAAGAHMSIAKAKFQAGHHEEALGVFQRLIITAYEVQRPMMEATARFRAARALWKLGRHDEALAAYAEALRMAVELERRDLELHCRADLAHLEYERGNHAVVVAAMRDVLVELEALYAGLSDDETAETRSWYSSMFHIGVAAAIGAKDPAALAYFVERARAGALRETLGSLAAFRTAALTEELRRVEADALRQVALAREALDQARRGGLLREIRNLRKGLEASLETLRTVVDRIQREAKRAAGVLYPSVADLDAVQAALREGEVLVSYGAIERKAYALVVGRETARIVNLPDGALDAAESLRPTEVAEDVAGAIAALRAAIVAPLALREGVRTVLVSPTGVFCTVPFGALIEDLDVALVPSATVLGLLREAVRVPGEGILALGDPSYDGRLTQLPATRDEAKAIGTKVLLREQATKEELRNTLAGGRDWRAVHFACHGLVDGERPERSALALTDGPLTALEIVRLDLATELTVLSACETARGRVVRSEGLLGFPRAFMFAGSPRVICSLWKVDDEATQALMIKFYELWNPKDGKQGMGCATALKRAQEYVRDHPDHPKWKHPYYWAAWVLWGLPE